MATATETSIELTTLSASPRQNSLSHQDIPARHVSESRPATTSSNPPQSTSTVMDAPAPDDRPAADSSVAPQLSGLAIMLIMTPLCLSVLLSALDLTMVTPAIPAIVESFHSSSGFVWIGGAFVLASTATTPIWGTVADIWGRKPIMLLAQALFLAGSLMCALAPSMDALIAGRVVQGVGASGMGMMVNTIICDTFSMRERGLYNGLTSAIWAVGSAVGPIIGGLFTTKANWRWCFWMNLPIGGFVFIVLLVVLKVPSPNTPILAGLKAIDWAGSILIVASALMLLLGLDFGGITFPWSSATVISLFVFGALILGFFVMNEWKLAANPVMPLRLFTRRSTLAAYAVYVCNYAVLIGFTYYLPLYSQAVLGANALVSGLQLLPLVISSSLAAAGAGIFIQKTGIYLPLMYLAQFLVMLGSGLFISLEVEQSLTKLVIFQLVAGVGFGTNLEPPFIAAQATVAVKDTAAVIATMLFLRSIMTALTIVLGGTIFQDKIQSLNDGLAASIGQQAALQFDGSNAAANVNQISLLPLNEQRLVKDAYVQSLRSVWIMCVGVASFSLLASLCVRGHHLKAEAEAVVLGLERTREDNYDTDRAPVITTGAHTPPITTVTHEEGLRLRT